MKQVFICGYTRFGELGQSVLKILVQWIDDYAKNGGHAMSDFYVVFTMNLCVD